MNPKSDAFVVGYAACEALFFPKGRGPGTPPADIDPLTVVNPFVEGSDQWRGFEEALTALTWRGVGES